MYTCTESVTVNTVKLPFRKVNYNYKQQLTTERWWFETFIMYAAMVWAKRILPPSQENNKLKYNLM